MALSKYHLNDGKDHFYALNSGDTAVIAMLYPLNTCKHDCPICGILFIDPAYLICMASWH